MHEDAAAEPAAELIDAIERALRPYEQHMAVRLSPAGTAPSAAAVAAAAAVLSLLVAVAQYWQTKRVHEQAREDARPVPDLAHIRESVLEGSMSVDDARVELLRFCPDDLSGLQRAILATSSFRDDLTELLTTLGIPDRLVDHVVGEVLGSMDPEAPAPDADGSSC